MLVRPETPADYAAIRQINIEAFAHHPYSQQTEHLIVEALRAAQALSLSLVAEVNGQVVGHIAFSLAKIDGKESRWFLVGPLAVLPVFQRRKIGSRLMEEGVAAIRKLGAEGCVLVGEPKFYCRFGFRNIPEMVMEGVPAEYVLCLAFTAKKAGGQVTHHPAFWVKA